MKKLFMGNLLIFTVLFLASSLHAGRIKNFILDTSQRYVLKVAANHQGLTTVEFPSVMEALPGINITRDKNKPAGFFVLAHDNSYFFSVYAERPVATGSLNIVWNHNIYVFKLITVPPDQAYSSVTFKQASEVVGSSVNRRTTPPVLRDLIKKARLYPVLKQTYPEYYDNMTIVHIGQKFEYPGYDITLQNTYRFEHEDTVVFQLVLKNNTDKTLVYDPHLLAVRVGSRLYYSSLTLGSGQIPPRGESPVWFTVTGTPSGGRNEEKAKNNWVVLLTADRIDQKPATLDIDAKIAARKGVLREQLQEINKRLNSTNLLPGEIKNLSTRIKNINNELKQLESTKKFTS